MPISKLKKLKLSTLHQGTWKLGPKKFITGYENTAYDPKPENQKVLTSTLNYAQAMHSFKELQDQEPSTKNKGELKRILADNRSSFCGGIASEVYTKKDIKEYNVIYKSLSKNIIKQSKVGSGLKRKRRKSEHEGNWDYSRRWETMPYEHIKKDLSAMPLVDMDVHLCFSSHVDSEAITKYGIFCSALVNYLESIGYIINLNLKSITKNTCAYLDFHEKVINIKKPSEYSNPQKLLTCFNSNFYRRVVFSHTALGADSVNNNIADGYGRTVEFKNSHRLSKGKLEIFSHSVANDNSSFISELQRDLRVL